MAGASGKGSLGINCNWKNAKQFNVEDVDCYGAAQSREMGKGGVYCQPT